MFSPCSAKRRASDKDLPVSVRFSHLAANILNELDNQSLLKCKEASRQLDQFVETERLICKRMTDNFTHLIFEQK
jgi:hypothetical protein